MTTRAQWVDGIPDLYEEGKLEEAGNYLTEVQVSELTGFAVTTIMNALSRQKITSTTNPLGPISRPVRRIGSKPLYSREQAKAALELRHKSGTRKRFGGQDEPLPSVTFEESERCGYRSVADLSNQVGVHEQTVRSWFRMYATAPKPVALRERHPDDPKGAPSVVFEGGPALQWMVDNDKIDPSVLKAA